MNRENIDKIARTGEDRLLLSRVYDRIHGGFTREIPTNTCFLSPRELELCRFLFGDLPGLHRFGGYQGAERQMLCYLPEYMEPAYLMGEDSPVVCLRAEFYQGDKLSHRDFLGALMGAGIARETIGDICVGEGRCDFFATAEIAPYLLQSFDSAGRSKLRLSQIPLQEAEIPQPEIAVIHDTVASIRLDSVISSGFRIGRSLAAQQIAAGKAAINGLPCEKPDKGVSEGDTVSLRGMGKLKLAEVGKTTKKGRISLTIHRYI